LGSAFSHPNPTFKDNADPKADPNHFDEQKSTKNLQLKNNNNIFFIKNSNLLIPRPPSRTSKLQEKPSVVQREHPAH
jgi:hypothetical protein